MNAVINRSHGINERLDGVGIWLAPLGLRLILAWEFWEAGIEKLRGENWFAHVMEKFPFPFNLAPVELSWSLATWTELLAAVALLLGLATRLTASALFVLTVVAIATVHWPTDWSSLSELWQGYAISDKGQGNYKLPLLYLLMLLPLILQGGGRLSLDALLGAHLGLLRESPAGGLTGWGLFVAVFGAILSILLPLFGGLLVLTGAAMLVASWWLRR
jgi:putative oxidoreductase